MAAAMGPSAACLRVLFCLLALLVLSCLVFLFCLFVCLFVCLLVCRVLVTRQFTDSPE